MELEYRSPNAGKSKVLIFLLNFFHQGKKWNNLFHPTLNSYRAYRGIKEKNGIELLQIVKEKHRPWIYRFSSCTELRSLRGSRRITDKTGTQKVQKRVRIELKWN